MTTSSVPKRTPSVNRIRYRGFDTPKAFTEECECPRYSCYNSTAGTGSGYWYLDHIDSCPKKAFNELYPKVFRFLLVSGGLYIYVATDRTKWNSWYNNIRPKDPRFEQYQSLVLTIGDEKVVLTPFPPLDQFSPCLTSEVVAELCEMVIRHRQYGSHKRVIESLGSVSLREIWNLRSSITLNPNNHAITHITSRWEHQARLEAHRREESLGSLGYGEREYRRSHHCEQCSSDHPVIDSYGFVCSEVAYLDVRQRYEDTSLKLQAQLFDRLLSVSGLDPSQSDFNKLRSKLIYESLMSEHKQALERAKNSEAQSRRKELDLVNIPDMGQSAMPKRESKAFMQLAESRDPTLQDAAAYISEISKTKMAHSYKKFKGSLVGMIPSEQKLIRSSSTKQLDQLIEAATAARKFRSDERDFLTEAREVIEASQRLSSESLKGWLAERWRRWDWNLVDPPPVRKAA